MDFTVKHLSQTGHLYQNLYKTRTLHQPINLKLDEGTWYVSFGGYSLQVSVTNGNPIATVTGICATCIPSYAIGGCGVSDISVAASCSDAGSNPKILYSDCPSGSLAVGCGLYWDAALTSPVLELFVFAEANWDMDGGGIISAYSSIQC